MQEISKLKQKYTLLLQSMCFIEFFTIVFVILLDEVKWWSGGCHNNGFNDNVKKVKCNV